MMKLESVNDLTEFCETFYDSFAMNLLVLLKLYDCLLSNFTFDFSTTEFPIIKKPVN